MKTPLFALAAATLMLVGASSTAWAQASTLTVDGAKSQIKFVSEAPAEKIVGTADKLSGKVEVDPQALTASGKISFPVASMQTGNKMRDKHMTGEDWLNAKANPQITFTVSSLQDAKVETSADKTVIKGLALGTVNVNGVDAPSKAQVTITLLSAKKIAKVDTKLQIKLADHKVAGKKGVVGAKVGETIDIDGTIYANIQ